MSGGGHQRLWCCAVRCGGLGSLGKRRGHDRGSWPGPACTCTRPSSFMLALSVLPSSSASASGNCCLASCAVACRNLALALDGSRARAACEHVSIRTNMSTPRAVRGASRRRRPGRCAGLEAGVNVHANITVHGAWWMVHANHDNRALTAVSLMTSSCHSSLRLTAARFTSSTTFKDRSASASPGPALPSSPHRSIACVYLVRMHNIKQP